jgi:hypothetical protein
LRVNKEAENREPQLKKKEAEKGEPQLQINEAEKGEPQLQIKEAKKSFNLNLMEVFSYEKVFRNSFCCSFGISNGASSVCGRADYPSKRQW